MKQRLFHRRRCSLSSSVVVTSSTSAEEGTGSARRDDRVGVGKKSAQPAADGCCSVQSAERGCSATNCRRACLDVCAAHSGSSAGSMDELRKLSSLHELAKRAAGGIQVRRISLWGVFEWEPADRGLPESCGFAECNYFTFQN
ncbi:hypothetical protein AAHA92_09831 [Salvia divinorum]|uniref:Uncharacterized protein n=1 Tax=Salvia divinorum TaxID=28513 RepID=A0ABD1HSN0_SALDI